MLYWGPLLAVNSYRPSQLHRSQRQSVKPREREAEKAHPNSGFATPESIAPKPSTLGAPLVWHALRRLQALLLTPDQLRSRSASTTLNLFDGHQDIQLRPGDACPVPNPDRWRNALAVVSGVGMEANMNAAFSFLISVGIIAFGIWIVAGTIAAGSPLAWALMGLLTVIVGSISLYQATRDVKTA